MAPAPVQPPPEGAASGHQNVQARLVTILRLLPWGSTQPSGIMAIGGSLGPASLYPLLKMEAPPKYTSALLQRLSTIG